SGKPGAQARWAIPRGSSRTKRNRGVNPVCRLTPRRGIKRRRGRGRLAPRLRSSPGVKPCLVVRDPATGQQRTGAPGIGKDVLIIGCLGDLLSPPVRLVGV